MRTLGRDCVGGHGSCRSVGPPGVRPGGCTWLSWPLTCHLLRSMWSSPPGGLLPWPCRASPPTYWGTPEAPTSLAL